MFSLNTKTSRMTRGCLILVLGAVASLYIAGCPSTQSKPNPQPQAATYQTPEAAVDALVAALRSNDDKELHRILGTGSDELLSSGDEVADANGKAQFLKLYDEKHGLETKDESTRILDVGATDWPLPIPVVKGDSGWYFDTPAGLDEMLSRRIGRNELDVIQVCLAIHDAQREYAAADDDGNGWREYAQKFKSSPGKHDGLFWIPKEGEPPSPLGVLVAAANAEGYQPRTDGSEGPRPYHGYYYRILTSQGPDAPGGSLNYITKGHMIGGFGVVAWPAEYGNSGLKTFITSHHGDVYEKDLGDDTDKIARTMTAFNPDPSWTKSQTDQMAQ
jgi:hypothetical protein